MTDFKAKPWLSAYAPGVPHEIPPVTETLVDMMAHSVREYDSRIALEFFGASISYRQLGERIARVAGGLRTLGVGHGDRVALVLPNCPQHVIAFYAILSLVSFVV
jgi:long-chain acyl-CoA synthetase